MFKNYALIHDKILTISLIRKLIRFMDWDKYESNSFNSLYINLIIYDNHFKYFFVIYLSHFLL